MAKQVADLQKQLGQRVTVEKPNEVADDKGKSAAQVASWKRVMNSMAASIKHAREEHIAEGESAEDKLKLGSEFEASVWVMDLKANVDTYQFKIDAALPKEQRARNVDADILEQEKQLKNNEASAKKTSETIAWATKKNEEATAKMKEIQANLVQLKGEKEKILLEQGGANRFDSFFSHETWTNLRANTSVGNRASELM